MPESSKIIRKRIKSTASTKKITRTMEMVATSKLQKTQGMVMASRPYMEALTELMEALARAGDSLALYPLFEKRDPVKRVMVFGVTANRGLCGGFNSNLVRKIRDHSAALEAEGFEVSLHVAGKKGIAALKFLEYEMAATRTDLTDSPDFAEADRVVGPMMQAFLDRDVDRVDVVFADFRSPGHQPPTAMTLLPVGGIADDEPSDELGEPMGQEIIFEPSPKEILEELGPTYVKNTMYRMLLSSVASEQLARRMAMKNATDNANEMEKSLTRQYNKARQAQITQELAEIVGGVEALK